MVLSKTEHRNFLCKNCRKQFQISYIKYNKANPATTQHLIVGMLLRNSGVRDIETVLKVSRRCVLNHLLKQAALCVIKPFQQRYKSVQIDEHWSYVGHKKDKKRVYLRLRTSNK